MRNYGCFVNDVDPKTRLKEGPLAKVEDNTPNKKALVGRTNIDFRQFDMAYADSDAWVVHNAPFPKQVKTYGRNGSRSRFAEWKRDFDKYVKDGSLPRFQILRFPNDHTNGTSPGFPTPRAAAADNDYAVGQLVEAVSKSPYWKKTAIFILEDDAQNGNDHVDAHRSTCYVISPFVKRGTVDSRFYNTDSLLRTMELLLGIKPMTQYDAIATPFGFFSDTPDNDEAYTAILPERAVIAEVNKATAYKARQSAKFSSTAADSVRDDLMSEIVWRSVKGRNNPMPAPRYGLRVAGKPPKRDADD
jgi:phospholipase C